MGLAEDLRALGVPAGGVVMVHASMRAVGGRAEDLVRALLSALGPGGTLLAYVDFEPGVFDVQRSPACRDYGVLPEVIRRWDGAVRSLNPGASMAAIGGRASWLCRDHPLRYGYGPGSPLGRLVDAGGEVLLLGSDPDQVTLLHYAEHVARLPGKRVIRERVPAAEGELLIEEFDTREGVVAAMPEGYFADVVGAFVASGGARAGVVGNARSLLLPAPALVSFAVAKMESEFG